MAKNLRNLTLVVVVLALCAASASGEIVIIGLTAEIAELDDPGDLLEGRIRIGDIITGSYTYDSDTPDSNPLSSMGAYWHYRRPYGISLIAGGFVFQTDPDNVRFLLGIDDGTYGHDTYLLRSYNNPPLSNGVHVDHISWQLDDYSSTALSSDVLPTTPPVLEDWGNNCLLIDFGCKGTSCIGGPITSVKLIPEPATFVLFALGGLALLKRRRPEARQRLP